MGGLQGLFESLLFHYWKASKRDTLAGEKTIQEAYNLLLQVLLKPSHGLQERLLLRKLRRLLGNITADSKSVLDVGEEVKLIGNVHLLEDVLSLAALGGREYVIGF